jgi:ABC-type sugar transport system substrate-binding protein
VNFSIHKICSLIVALLGLGLVSCTKTTDEKPGATGGESIAVFTKNQTNPYFQTVRLGAENAAKQMNVSVTQYIPTKPDDHSGATQSDRRRHYSQARGRSSLFR